MTTSLTETPKAFFTVLTRPRSTLRKATRRCGVIGLLNGVAGARPGTVGITAPSPRPRPSFGPEWPRCGELTSARSEIKENGEQLRAGHAIDRGMVNLGVDRGPAPGQPGNQ